MCLHRALHNWHSLPHAQKKKMFSGNPPSDRLVLNFFARIAQLLSDPRWLHVYCISRTHFERSQSPPFPCPAFSCRFFNLHVACQMFFFFGQFSHPRKTAADHTYNGLFLILLEFSGLAPKLGHPRATHLHGLCKLLCCIRQKDKT